MIIRSLVRFWRWLHTKPVNQISDGWLRTHSGTTYDDDPRARARR